MGFTPRSTHTVMSLTRRNWFLHRVAPAAVVMGTAAGPLASAAGAAAGGPHVDRRTKKTLSIDPKLPVHPSLQYGAQVEPDKKVQIIVEKKAKSASSAAIASAAGSRLLREYPF